MIDRLTTTMLTARRLFVCALSLAATPAFGGPCLTCDSGLGLFPLGWWHGRPLSAAGRVAAAPRIDVDVFTAAPRIAVVWQEITAGRGNIWLAVSDDGGCSFASRALTTGPEDDRSPDVVVALRADALIVAFTRDGRVNAMASADGGTTFSTPEPIHTTAGADSPVRLAAAFVNGDLHAHVVWTDAGDLHHARSLDGGSPGSWSSGPPLSDRLAGFAEWTDATVAADTRSEDAVFHSGVTIAARARPATQLAFAIASIRSNDSGTRFFGDPIDPATIDRPHVVSDPRADDPAVSAGPPHLDDSDDGSGLFQVWNVLTWSEPGPRVSVIDARGEEGVTPSVIADWNDPPASGDVLGGPAAATAAGVSVVPNPVNRPPTPELHLFYDDLVGAPDVAAWRGRLDAAATPTVDLFCGPYRLTGEFPIRSDGAVASASFDVDEDLSHAYAVWIDTRDGERRVWYKRSDSVTAPPVDPSTDPAACAAGGGLLVSWSPPADPPHCDLDRVRVEWGTQPGVYDDSTEVAGATEVTLTGLVERTTYHLRLTTIDEACNEKSAAEITGTTLNCTGVPLCPHRVSNTLLAWKSSDRDLSLVWQEPPFDALHDQAQSFDRWRSIVGALGPWSPVGSSALLEWVDVGALVTSDDQHQYRVVARNSCGTSGDEPPN